MWSPQGWELIFRRDSNEWDMNRMIEFYKQLDNFPGTQNGDDTLRWQGHSSGKFSVSVAYKMINQWRTSHQLALETYLEDQDTIRCCTLLWITNQLWKIFINLRDIAWTMPRKIIEALFSCLRWVPACI
ncbi:hypothetical protein H5410_015691 [Solanum commersonii]|uniref:Uncharacterized protein n=1 Tax=Solanum commersonii TaxID=4109 RepID=A0A9J5ZUU6_SOLCO|nr:hypothetical protein H5410_015691 [Solanum commersonii]